MFNFLKSKQTKISNTANYNSDGIPSCPKCNSTSLQAEPGEGTGGLVMGAASIGSVSTPVLGGPSISPLPPVKMTAENFHGSRMNFTCHDCGYQFWGK